jgi:cell division septation protein DedD
VLKSDGWKNPFSLTPAPEAPSSPALPRPPVETKKLPGSAAASPETAAIAETITDAGSPADNDSATTGPTANEWRVQFAAFRNAREAERALEKLNSRAGAEIGRTPRIINVADLGDRGIFRRIQAGPLDGREAVARRQRSCVRW